MTKEQKRSINNNIRYFLIKNNYFSSEELKNCSELNLKCLKTFGKSWHELALEKKEYYLLYIMKYYYKYKINTMYLIYNSFDKNYIDIFEEANDLFDECEPLDSNFISDSDDEDDE